MHAGSKSVSKSFALLLAFALGGYTITLAQVAPARTPQTIAVDHLAPDCLEAGRYPELRLCLKEAMARAHIVFRPGREGRGGPLYMVPMESRSDPLGSCFVGLLPRPVMSIRERRVTYQFLVTRSDLEQMESRVYEAEVVRRASQCKNGRVAQSRDTGAPNVSLAEGEQGPSFPEGFAPSGDAAEAPEAADQPAAKAAGRGGPDAGKVILGTLLLGGAAAGVAVAAGQLASVASGRCV